MNLFNFISNENQIGGLEISDDNFRFSLLKKTKSELKISLLIEEKINEKGVLINDASFIAKLLKFSKKNRIEYVVVSVPADNTFVKTYNFPLVMSDEKINESIKLNVELQLPKKKEDIYCDWMKIEEKDDKKVLLSYIQKDFINGLLEKINKAGLKIVAVENHPLSISRSIKQKTDEAVLVVEKSLKTSSFSVIKNNKLIFSQPALNEKIGNNLNKEIQKIINYHDWINIEIKNLILLGNFNDQETKKLPLKAGTIEFVDELKQAPKDTKWLITLGAALRGLMPRKEDKIISLMEIGTEKAYRQEKTDSTINFLISISVALSAFFIIAFTATWSIITVMQNNYNQRIQAFSLTPSSENDSTLSEKTTAFNDLMGQTGALIQQTPYWSKVISEIKDKNTDGIIINNLSLSSASEQLSITGLATNREAINNLKKSFESSSLFSNINIPLNNLGKKVDIPFSMTFKIRDPKLIYLK
jgi:Tfp pilus assembly PilM family ATPase